MASIQARGMVHVSQYGAAHRAPSGQLSEPKHAFRVTGVRLVRLSNVPTRPAHLRLNPGIHMEDRTNPCKLSSDLYTLVLRHTYMHSHTNTVIRTLRHM